VIQYQLLPNISDSIERGRMMEGRMAVLVYKQCSEPLDISTFPPFVSLVISIEQYEPSNPKIDITKTMYRLSIISRGVQLCAPHLPNPPLFSHSSLLVRFILCRVINFYRTSLYFPPISEAIEMLRRR
jgi:hypothetical protein